MIVFSVAANRFLDPDRSIFPNRMIGLIGLIGVIGTKTLCARPSTRTGSIVAIVA
jgi:hypothetical protein